MMSFEDLGVDQSDGKPVGRGATMMRVVVAIACLLAALSFVSSIMSHGAHSATEPSLQEPQLPSE